MNGNLQPDAEGAEQSMFVTFGDEHASRLTQRFSLGFNVSRHWRRETQIDKCFKDAAEQQRIVNELKIRNNVS